MFCSFDGEYSVLEHPAHATVSRRIIRFPIISIMVRLLERVLVWKDFSEIGLEEQVF